MSTNKKTDMFAKLVAQQSKPAEVDSPEVGEPLVEEGSPPPAPPTSRAKASASKAKPEGPKGYRHNPDYCQANAYVPKSLRKAVNRALLDVDGMDYSSLVTDLLRKWVKSRGVSE